MLNVSLSNVSLGLLGYGAFGRLIHPYLAESFNVRVYDPSPPPPNSGQVNFTGLKEAASSDIVVIATPVQVMAGLAREVSAWLKPSALVLDVGSVKVLPAQVLVEHLPAHVDLICTHPLFGPQSAAGGISGLKIVVCPIRGKRLPLVRWWLERRGLTVIESTIDDHDRDMAVTQGITHLIAKVVAEISPIPSVLTTPSFELLVRATEQVRYDAPSVFRAIERDNPYAKAVRQRFFDLADSLRRQLDQEDNEGN